MAFKHQKTSPAKRPGFRFNEWWGYGLTIIIGILLGLGYVYFLNSHNQINTHLDQTNNQPVANGNP